MSDTAPLSLEALAAARDELCGVEDPVALLAEVFTRFGARAAIGTSGQLSGVTLIDMAARGPAPFRVFAVDTLRLHPSTYALWDRLEARYGVTFERFRATSGALDRMVRQHGEYLFFDSRYKQEHCCDVRKVRPTLRALDTLDVWVTGLRRDQSPARAETPRAELVEHEGRPVLKIAPIVEWSVDQVEAWIAAHDVPYDPLFDPRPDGARYKSLGCVICTTPVRPGEPNRAGRWRWQNSADEAVHAKECGIHLATQELDTL